MRKKTSTVIGLAIATILTASALTMSNQAFAVAPNIGCVLGGGEILGQSVLKNDACTTAVLGQTLAGHDHVPHVGQALGGITTTIHNILGGSINRLGCGTHAKVAC
jgi:hypothetical protein